MIMLLALTLGMGFLILNTNLDVTRLLWTGKERTIESFQGFFTAIGEKIVSKIVFICSDMWEPYLKVIREKCSEAAYPRPLPHRGQMNKALDEVRADETHRMRREGGDPVFKRMFDKFCQCQVHRMWVYASSSCPEADVSTY